MKKVCFVALALTSIPCLAFAAEVELPRTGQTTCYDDNGNGVVCAGTGQDGEVQAGVAWPSPRFTPGTGAESDCMIDNLTGLMWPKDGNLPNGTMTWDDAKDYPKTLTLCGHSDWRLPNINELESLVNVSQPSTAAWLNTQGFDVVQSGLSSCYWSSSTYAGSTGNARDVYMYYGFTGYDVKGNSHLVWPVRGGQVRPIITLTIAQTGQGSGSVTSDPGTVTWNGTNGFASYYYSIPATLTAQPNAGSIFSGWSGAGCQGTGTCTVNLNSDTTVTAIFEREPVGKGDINYDGQLNLIDAVLALQVIAGISPQQTVYKDANVNGDAEIGFAEVIFIPQKTSGLRQ